MTQENSEYIDRETDESFGSAGELINNYIRRFSAKVSEATGVDIVFDPIDDDGYTSVSRGSATVGINVLEEQGVLLFLSRIMKVPSENREAFFQHLLTLNYLATADGAFAIEKKTETVVLRAHRAILGLDYEEFEDMLHTVATVADEWDDKLIEQFS